MICSPAKTSAVGGNDSGGPKDPCIRWKSRFTKEMGNFSGRKKQWESLGFIATLFLFFPLFFVSGPCARLSWPSRQLLSAR